MHSSLYEMPQTENQTTNKFCNQCGRQQEPDTFFCGECGTRNGNKKKINQVDTSLVAVDTTVAPSIPSKSFYTVTADDVESTVIATTPTPYVPIARDHDATAVASEPPAIATTTMPCVPITGDHNTTSALPIPITKTKTKAVSGRKKRGRKVTQCGICHLVKKGHVCNKIQCESEECDHPSHHLPEPSHRGARNKASTPAQEEKAVYDPETAHFQEPIVEAVDRGEDVTQRKILSDKGKDTDDDEDAVVVKIGQDDEDGSEMGKLYATTHHQESATTVTEGVDQVKEASTEERTFKRKTPYETEPHRDRTTIADGGATQDSDDCTTTNPASYSVIDAWQRRVGEYRWKRQEDYEKDARFVASLVELIATTDRWYTDDEDRKRITTHIAWETLNTLQFMKSE